jgi:hypothetical protein
MSIDTVYYERDFVVRETDRFPRSIVSDKKTIAVLGATGAQGGGLVRSILAGKNARSRRAR